MKKLIIELEDSTYKKLTDVFTDVKKNFPEAKIEVLASELLTSVINVEHSIKDTKSNLSNMLKGMDLDPSNLSDMFENFKDMMNMNTEKPKKPSKPAEDEEELTEEEFKS